MARSVFFSFHYKPDSWRASQIRNAGVIEGNQAVSDNDWEQITNRGDAAIQAWIDQQLVGRSCAVVLIGAATAGRKWITYEINRAWNSEKGVVGIYVHNLQDSSGNQITKGGNPFDHVWLGSSRLSSVVKAYDPPYSVSTYVYKHITENIAAWADEAVSIRSRY